MTKTFATMEANHNVTTETDNEIALQKNSNSRTRGKARRTWVSREKFIRLLLAHRGMERCDDRNIGLRGLMEPATGDCFFIEEDDLFSTRTA